MRSIVVRDGSDLRRSFRALTNALGKKGVERYHQARPKRNDREVIETKDCRDGEYLKEQVDAAMFVVLSRSKRKRARPVDEMISICLNFVEPCGAK